MTYLTPSHVAAFVDDDTNIFRVITSPEDILLLQIDLEYLHSLSSSA